MTPLEVNLKKAVAINRKLSEAPILIVMVGLPRSGKSTWAREQSLPIVNLDSVRLAMHGKPFLQDAEPWVWLIVKTMIRALFTAGHYVVILDATNNSRKRRADWINPAWQLVFKVVLVNPELCEQRAINTSRSDLIPIIRRMHDQWEPLMPDEGPILEDLVKCD